ncbi:hypothetical protein BV20DRAFT_1052137 [Pilatotrama ljubarskyi]|nr:hypothetical protein BV20DRAFT_1052137 [Pilatotrama ljubarskyi]
MSITQNAYYVGNHFDAIFYGAELSVWFLTIKAVRKPGRQSSPTDKVLMAFSTVLLFLSTVFLGAQAGFGQNLWIVNAGYPGGMDEYFANHALVWYRTLGSAASVLLNLLCNALLIYRCYVIWADKGAVVFPIILWLTTLGCGFAQLGAASVPDSDYVDATAARAHSGVSAVFVESAALTALCGIPYIITYSMGDYTEIFFLSVYVMSTCLAPQLIILRMMSGQAWTLKRTKAMLTTMPSARLDRTATISPTSTIIDDTNTLGKGMELQYAPTAAEKA